MSSTDRYDVIVAGAGPGGAAAAFFLGEAGRRVLVLEKETLPRYKACGGAISTSLLGEFPFAFDPVIEAPVKAVAYACRGETVTFDLPRCPIRMVMRADFDHFLLRHAKAEIRQGEAVVSVAENADQVTVRTSKGMSYAGSFLVGADGPNSVVAHALGLRRNKTLLGAIEVEAPVPPDVYQAFKDTSVFIFGEIGMGYLWVFPKAEHLSVGIGALYPRPGELQSTLARVMGAYRIPVADLPMHGHPVPIYTRREKLSTARALLVGDAAGLVDPMSGEGIRYAVKSGRMAAGAILGGNIQHYDADIYRQIGIGHRIKWAIAQTVYAHPGACFELFAHNPFARQAFVDLYSERGGMIRLMLRLVASLPPYLVTKWLAEIAGLVRLKPPR